MTRPRAPLSVIPAQAGIHRSTSASGPMDPRLRGDDGVGGTVEGRKLADISLQMECGMMGFFDNIGKMIDRYGRTRTGKGPKVASGPSKGLTRARNKDGRWGASKKRK